MNTLKIYRAVSGQWSGIIIEDGQEIGRVAGCESPEDVEQAACDVGYLFNEVELNREASA